MDLSFQVTSLVKSHFKHFQTDHKSMYQAFDELLKSATFTASGNRRLPQYVTVSAKNIYIVVSDMLRDQNCIYCYKVDGVLYTTYNKKNKNKYSFIGETKIPNYRKNKKVDQKVLKGEYSESGFYYANGKPYFVTLNENK